MSCPAPVSMRTFPRAGAIRRQHGVVLFIALLVMVALSLAGIALIRSADTATIVAGNLAFKQAAASAADRSIEQAIAALFDPVAPPLTPTPLIVNKNLDLLAQNYYACVQNDTGTGCLAANAPIPEIPVVLTTKAKFAAAGLNVGLVDASVDAANNKGYYVIERMCASAGAAAGANCNMSAAGLGSDAGRQHDDILTLTGGAFYRVTVRVEGPRNTVAYAQAILQ